MIELGIPAEMLVADSSTHMRDMAKEYADMRFSESDRHRFDRELDKCLLGASNR